MASKDRGMGKKLVGAVMLGFGTILQPKIDPEDHWSASPKVVLVIEADADESGGLPR